MLAAQMAKKPQMAREGYGADCPHSLQRKPLCQHLNLGLMVSHITIDFYC